MISDDSACQLRSWYRNCLLVANTAPRSSVQDLFGISLHAALPRCVDSYIQTMPLSAGQRMPLSSGAPTVCIQYIPIYSRCIGVYWNCFDLCRFVLTLVLVSIGMEICIGFLNTDSIQTNPFTMYWLVSVCTGLYRLE